MCKFGALHVQRSIPYIPLRKSQDQQSLRKINLFCFYHNIRCLSLMENTSRLRKTMYTKILKNWKKILQHLKGGICSLRALFLFSYITSTIGIPLLHTRACVSASSVLFYISPSFELRVRNTVINKDGFTIFQRLSWNCHHVRTTNIVTRQRIANVRPTFRPGSRLDVSTVIRYEHRFVELQRTSHCFGVQLYMR